MSFSLYGFNSGFYGNNPHSQRGNGYFNNFLSNEQKKKKQHHPNLIILEK